MTARTLRAEIADLRDENAALQAALAQAETKLLNERLSARAHHALASERAEHIVELYKALAEQSESVMAMVQRETALRLGSRILPDLRDPSDLTDQDGRAPIYEAVRKAVA